MNQHDAVPQPSDDVPPEERPSLPLADKLSCGVGTFLAAGVVDLVAHLGPTGLVVGGIAAYVASQHGPELLEQVRGKLPTRPSPVQAATPRFLVSESNGGKRSLLDRALGRFPAHEDEETIIVDEPEREMPRAGLFAHLSSAVLSSPPCFPLKYRPAMRHASIKCESFLVKGSML